MHCVDLYAVKAGALGIVGCIAELLNNGMDLIHREGTAGLIQPPVWDGGGGYRRELAQVGGDCHAAKPAGQLQKYLSTVGVDTLGHLPGGTYKMNRIIGGAGAAWHSMLLNLVVHKGNTGNDQSRATLGALGIVINAALVEATFRIAQAQRAHRSHSEPVL